ncbi:GlcG/HbpS family heme-binding protein [Candidatus Frankia nodulisporulans]|uniref:GlcG/HbpS family heme-binding protein n=1 Tax=Candidatus Frankia nodulisporulans TaxID=2060052 RepID=UPI0013D0A8BA|nr:heme-binding protein [Candidatus Frankia nodulisporulans]
MTVSLEDARRIIAAGERYAIHLGQPVNIAVVDHAGILVAHVRMDNARLRTADISVDRACAARASALPAVPARLVHHGGDDGPAEWSAVGIDADPGDVDLDLDRGGGAGRVFADHDRDLDRGPGGRGIEGGLVRHRPAFTRPISSGLTGAVPLWRDGLVVGAVGVSGGPTPHDEAIARAAAAAY